MNYVKLNQWWETEKTEGITNRKYFEEVIYPWSECRSWLSHITLQQQPWAKDFCYALSEIQEGIINEEPNPENPDETFIWIDWMKAMHTIATLTLFVRKSMSMKCETLT
jgi:hypothetical protein